MPDFAVSCVKQSSGILGLLFAYSSISVRITRSDRVRSALLLTKLIMPTARTLMLIQR